MESSPAPEATTAAEEISMALESSPVKSEVAGTRPERNPVDEQGNDTPVAGPSTPTPVVAPAVRKVSRKAKVSYTFCCRYRADVVSRKRIGRRHILQLGYRDCELKDPIRLPKAHFIIV